MRVLHLHSGNLYGGVETMLTTIARHGDSCPEMESHFALCFDGRLGDELRGAGAHVYKLPCVRVSRPASVFRARAALMAMLRQKSFDVALCHSAWTQAIFGKVVRASSLPLVFWSHAPAGGHWLERWARRTPPDFVVCNSHYTARSIGSLYPHARAEVIYCPVELQDLSHYRTHESRAEVRAELDTHADATVVIQVSRMEECKGHSLHLRALGLLPKSERWVCWMVGGGQRTREREYEERLKAEAGSLGLGERVRFTGQRVDVPRLLAAADIYSQPNTSPESFGLAFVEAMRAGLPVLTTDIGGAREVVDDSCGILVAPCNRDALAAQLRRLLEDQTLGARMGQAGQARARLLCDPHAQTGKLFGLLKKVVGAESQERFGAASLAESRAAQATSARGGEA